MVTSTLARAVVLVLLLALSAETARAQTVQLDIDRTQVVVGEPFTISVTVSGRTKGDPKVEGLAEFDVRSTGTSTQMQFLNGQSSSSKTYRFEAIAKRAGTFRVGPAHVKRGKGSGEVASTTRTLVVQENTAANKVGRPFLVEAEVDNTTPYVGEQVRYTLRFLRNEPIEDARMGDANFEGFTKINRDGQRETEVTREGTLYRATEITWILFPERAGRITIPQVTIEGRLPGARGQRGFLGGIFNEGRRVGFPSNAVELEISALPPAPPSFSGLVGGFALDARATPSKLSVGNSSSLELVLTGTGDARGFEHGRLGLPDALKLYPEKAEVSIQPQGIGINTVHRQRFALVPTIPGRFEIPAISITVFDPKQGIYATVHSNPVSLLVSGTAVSAPQSKAPSAPEVSPPASPAGNPALDLKPIVTQPRGRLVSASWVWLVILTLLGPTLFTALIGAQRYRQAQRALKAQRRRAFKEAKAVLNDWPTEPEEQSHRLATCLRMLLHPELNGAEEGLTEDELGAALDRYGLPEDVQRDLSELLGRAQANRFSAKSSEPIDPDRLGHFIQTLEAKHP